AGGKLYWRERGTGSSAGRILRANLDGSDPEVLVAGLASEGRTLALDLEAGLMYWGEPGEGVYRAALDGSGSELLVANQFGGAQDMVIDTLQDRLYLAASDRIIRCELTPVSCSALSNERASALEIEGTTLYFLKRSNGSLWAADLDGQNAVQVSFGLPHMQDFRLDTANGHVYLAEPFLLRADLDGSNQVSLVAGIGTDLHDVAVDGAGERLYFSDFTERTVTTAGIGDLLFTSLFLDPDTSSDFAEIRGIALDPDQGRLFFAQGLLAPNGGIWRIDLATPSRTQIVTGLNVAHDVAYDPIGDKIYWTTGLDDPTVKIQRSNPDGTGVEDVLTDLPNLVRGIEIATVRRKVYWTDMANGQIHRADLDGSAPEMVVSGLDRPHDVAIDSTAGRMYWVEGIQGNDVPGASIRSSTLDGAGVVDVVTGLSRLTRDLTFVYHRRLPFFADGFESGDTSAWSGTLP
ncbi:MAG: hypothetical protein KDD47_23975, partial [Acidobacteria bacterium]|nr:hypothetical protein [Acidobacteriota bacterium]